MSKDIAVAGQGGVVVFDRNTPATINGLGTYGLETCMALIVVGDMKIGLLHLDKQTSLDSVGQFLQHFGEVTDFKVAFNKALYDARDDVQDSIAEMGALIQQLGYTITQDKTLFSTTGAVLIEVDRSRPRGWKLDFFDHVSVPNIKQRNAYDSDYEALRKSIHFLHRVFLDDQPVDVQFDGRHFTPMVALDAGLCADLEALRYSTHAQKVQWLNRDDVKAKYPHLVSYIDGGLANNIAQQIQVYFVCDRSCVLGTYEVPDVEGAKSTKIDELIAASGPDAAKCSQRQTDWSLTVKMTVKSCLLLAADRQSLGLERKRITTPNAAQREYLTAMVPGITVETEKEPRPERAGKSLVTYPNTPKSTSFVSKAVSNWAEIEQAVPVIQRAAKRWLAAREAAVSER